MRNDFATSCEKALNDPALFLQHRRVMDGLAANRRKALGETENFELKRKKAHAIRLNALNRLPELLREFEENATKNGAKIHWADTPEDANRIVEGILSKRNARRVVKGKSMISEETHLNAYLEERGYEVTESDLGELIVQIAGETPSHIIAPAVHKNVRQIAELFSEKLGMEYSEEIPDLIAFARSHMRDKYFAADAGITGVNFAVAETGALCLVENEGNGRFSTTVPKLHVAMMSLDKIVAKTTDLSLILELLTKSATGQRITSYVNLINGPRKTGEKDGPDEVHAVILNNGRTEILKDPLLRETLKCIRCGACINNCPVYVNIGGHAYNAPIPGPIGKILMPQLYGMKEQGVLATASSLCGACVDVCPVKIPITDILLELRSGKVKELRERKIKPNLAETAENLGWKAWAALCSNPRQYSATRKFIGLFSFALNSKMPVMNQWMKYRAKPKISKTTLAEMAEKEGFYERE